MTVRTSIPEERNNAALPSLAIISISFASNADANSIIPVLSETEINALDTFFVGIARFLNHLFENWDEEIDS